MITEVCLYLKNWFDFQQPKFLRQKFTIKDGAIVKPAGLADKIQTNQYYRIVGSVFNDGVHKRGSEELVDEEFTGALWLMAVPKDVLDLISEIEAWQAKYGSIDSENMSPYQSESFAGYSYSKANGGNSENTGSSVPTWQGVFGARLRRYKKI